MGIQSIMATITEEMRTVVRVVAMAAAVSCVMRAVGR
jgi:hypothetical protein